MAAEDSGTGTGPRGFFDSLKALLASLVALLETRLDLISTELEEEEERFKEMIALGAIALFCAGLGILFLTLLIVVVFWDTHRFYVLGGFAFLYLGLGLIAGLILRKKALSKPRLFSATLSELAKDREQLKS
jgi:uncharacterized membrane protein YqjE